MLAVVIVTTSLKMPQILNVTTLVRFSRANSDDVIKKARQPGKSRMPMPRAVPFASNRFERPSPNALKPSTGTARTNKLTNITGARKNIDEKGFAVAGFRRRRIWVSDHRKPDEHADAITRMKPSASNAVSPATIMTTPTVMTSIIKTSLQDGCSRRKRNAKIRTKPRADDLHIAGNIY
jgi:hypothetical protein